MELWENYHFCPRCGAAAVIEEPPLECLKCGFIRYFNPACAVAALAIEPQGRALFIRRARQPAQGKLAMPGGFIDAGETAEAALRREVSEEVGVRLGALEYLGSWPNRYPTASGVVDICDIFFVAEVTSKLTEIEEEEVSGVEWIAPAEVDPQELAFDSMRAALSALLARGGGRPELVTSRGPG